jgi:predicted DCC family thiol-disulfide oxidoreductase YuxK
VTAALSDREARTHTVVYDGTCRVCVRSANLLRRWDRDSRLELVTSQAPGTLARFPWIPAAAFADALQLIGPGGKTWQGAEALEELLRVLPRGKWIAWLFGIPFARGLADRFYRWFARNRYRLGCADHCRTRPRT